MTESAKHKRSELIDAFIRLALVWCAQALLHICYRDFISPRNDSAGLVFYNPGIQNLILWNLLFSLPVLALPKDWARPAHIILWYLYIVLVLPLGVLSLDMGKDDTLVLATTSFVLPFCLMLGAYRLIRPKTPLQFAKIPVPAMTIGVTLVCLAGSLLLFHAFGKSMSLSWDAVYDRRIEARSATGLRSLLGYGLTLFSQAAIPIGIALSLRKFGLSSAAALPAIVGSIIIFGFNGTKAALLMPALLVMLAFALALRWTKGWHLLCGLIILLIADYVLDAGFENFFLSEFVIRRMFAIPVQLVHAYLDFFQPANYLYFSDLPFMGSILGNVYDDRSASFIIGQEYFGNSELNANVGAIAYGYAELGLAGSWLMCAGILVLLILVERGSINKNARWTVPLACAIGHHLSEQAFQTALLSGGILPILAVFLLSKDKESKQAPTTVALDSANSVLARDALRFNTQAGT
jgi:hypothetical protein